MNKLRIVGWLLALTLGPAVAQSAPAQSAPAQTAPQTTPNATPGTTPVRHHRRKINSQATPQTQIIGRETAPPSAPAPLETSAQKVADERLLQQQQAQSAQAAAVQNQVVQKAQEQQQKVQQEVRIQDAPGPAQTGIVPAAGPPVAPPNTDQRIQDAPGPAQTLPALPAAPAPPATVPTQPAPQA